MSLLTDQEVGDLLRDAEFAMAHARAALVAFVATEHARSVSRDYDRLGECLRDVKAALVHFPPALPLTPDEEQEAADLIGRALRSFDV